MPQKLLTLLFLLLGMFSYSQTVVINEIDADTPGADVKEFIELKSFDSNGIALPNFSLDGYVLVFYRASTNTIYRTIDLDGLTTDINGIIHFGNSQVTPTPFFIIPLNGIQNSSCVASIYRGNDVDFPVDSATFDVPNLVDAFAHSNNTTQPTYLMGQLGISRFYVENDVNSIQRKNDGTFEVKSPTPGVNNDGSGIPINYITVSFPQASFNEGDSFNITFTTSQPVQNENLIMNFTLANGNFTNLDFSGGLTVMIPVGQTSTQNGIILSNDGFDEGDEEMKFVFQPLPVGYVSYNNNMVLRVNDANFATDPWGTPLNPTYNVVTSTIPAGYYDSLEGLSGSALKQAVQNIIANPAVVRLHSYADIWEILRTSDRNPLNNNQVWCIYTEVPFAKLDQQNTSSIVGKWNREHIFCQSRGGFEVANGDTADGINFWTTTSAFITVDGVSDAHHIRAVSGQENSSRNNKNYGPVNTSTVYAGPSGTQGSWRGDVARALFYMAVRFDALNVVNGDPVELSSGNPSYSIGDLATLLTWNTTDPRDDFEKNRNNYIYTWQMNRNPFIDHPNLADYIFGANFGQPWSSTLSNQNPIENRVAVYPNPASEYLIVSGLEGASKVDIYTITGQLVQSQDFESEIQLNLNLNAGMYLVKVTNGNEYITKKIIVK
ncbi:endonuclease [Flavobacterium lacisediminis]|uniref:Endonuclease n=1 Tax=Flavobacterium lacisediminis TaxID=2989705 RepID=A0ABT3EJ34_9FLAO|nr:endonuclease [Flavobacterium lacisediminis]MCW1148578.1 endonuclease [Flavobacterium lacisediminis]